jgi:hypothetical protein
MKLRRDIQRDVQTGDIRMTGQCYWDDGDGIHSGWQVKSWSDPTKPELYLPADFHWVILKSRKVVRWAHGYYADVHPPQDAPEDPLIDPRRKAFILSAVDKWERERFD